MKRSLLLEIVLLEFGGSHAVLWATLAEAARSCCCMKAFCCEFRLAATLLPSGCMRVSGCCWK